MSRPDPGSSRSRPGRKGRRFPPAAAPVGDDPAQLERDMVAWPTPATLFRRLVYTLAGALPLLAAGFAAWIGYSVHAVGFFISPLGRLLFG